MKKEVLEGTVRRGLVEKLDVEGKIRREEVQGILRMLEPWRAFDHSGQWFNCRIQFCISTFSNPFLY